MNKVDLIPKAIFAFRTDVKQNAHYISDFQILYPAGSTLIFHNYFEGRQKYIKLYDKAICLEMITVSPSRKLAAVIQNGEKGQIAVYDTVTFKKLRVLILPAESKTNRFETISFSHDDMYIMAITGEPDWNLLTYKWRKGKLSSSVRATNPNNTAPVVQICCSPVDNKEICIIGPGLFRILVRNETVWRQVGFQRAESLNLTSVTYLSAKKILCGTSDGKLIYIENGDLKGIFNAITARTLNIRDSGSSIKISSSLLVNKLSESLNKEEDLAVRALISFPKGFAYSCKIGLVHVFEKERVVYRKKNVYRICDPNLGDMSEMDFNVVKHLSINVSQDKLLATTNRSQLYTVRLWGPDINVAPEIPFKLLGQPLHHGDITGLGFSALKPYFATCGNLDRTIRLWNYETETVQLVKHYNEGIIRVDMHPSGNFLAATFLTRVELNVVLLNDLRCFRTLPMQECKIVRYGWMGAYLAISNVTDIEVYNVTLYTPPLVLKGLVGKPTCIQWLKEDKIIASCSQAGEILFWDIFTGQKVREISAPDVSFVNFHVTVDGKFTYAVATDGLLREFADSTITRAVKFGQWHLDSVNLPRSNLALLLTGDSSGILTVKMPLTEPPDFSIFHFHLHKITHFRLSFDDQYAVSVSLGGALIIWKLSVMEGRSIPVDKNFAFSTEILINKNELADKIEKIKYLSQKLYELEVKQLKENRDTEAKYCEKIKEIHEFYTQMIENLKEQIQQTEIDQNDQLINLKNEVDELKKLQEKEKEDLIENYQNKLSVEYKKVQDLEAIKAETMRDFEEQLAELEKSKVEETAELISAYEKKLTDVNNLLQETHEKHAKALEEHETLKVNLEDDADREIVEMRAKYEGLLKEEREQNVTFKEEAVVMRKKYMDIVKEREEFRQNLANIQEEWKKYQANIQNLEKDVTDLKAEIVERDSAIEEKEERITELKKKIQELDKFKFVLEIKTKELRKLIEPKDREIREKNEQIVDMEMELENLKKLNSSLELQLAELNEKTYGTEKEVNLYERKHRIGVSTLRQIKVDIYNLYLDLNDYKRLKEGIRALCFKYRDCEIVEEERFGESDLQRELLIQREHLEKTIVALKSALGKRKKTTDGTKVIRDNVVLLEELNMIRKQLKEAVWTITKLENLVGINKSKKTVIPSEAFNKIQQAMKKQDDLKLKYEKVISEAEHETETLNVKAVQMQQKLASLMEREF